jgi:biotin operon repressor
MQFSLHQESISSTIPSLGNHQLPINLSIHANFDLASLHSTTTEHASYIPYPNCVLEHILLHGEFTDQEKIYYILADSLRMINQANGKQHGSALSSEQWAKKLNCSKTKIFALQKSLEDKGYFNIIRDVNKYGKNKRNVINPTIPDSVFSSLATTPNRYNTTTSNKLSDIYIPHLESKRAYLDQTKMFIRLNYHILSLISSEQHLTSHAKVMWLDFYNIGYRYYLKHHNSDKNTTDINNDYVNNLHLYS